MRAVWTAAVLAVVAIGCSPKYRLNSNTAESPVLSGNCPLQVYESAPDRPFSLIGEIEPKDPSKLVTEQEAFVKAIRETACKHGGNAVIALKDEAGRYVRGTVISVR